MTSLFAGIFGYRETPIIRRIRLSLKLFFLAPDNNIIDQNIWYPYKANYHLNFLIQIDISNIILLYLISIKVTRILVGTRNRR